MKKHTLGKLAAIITQNGQCFYNRELIPFAIGWGQQFLLLRIHENEGTSIQDLAKKVFLDQSTTTRALQKLQQQGYIRYEVNQTDHRIRHIYTTENALPVIEAAHAAQQKWDNILIRNMTVDEAGNAHYLLKRMAQNAFEALHGEDQARGENRVLEEK